MRVVVAMSGGVDSSAAAALLAAEGHEVIGVALRLNHGSAAAPGRCCSPDDLEDARRVAERLAIPFYVFEATALFDEAVIGPFVSDYLAGETPVPCLACNRQVKFGHLLARARALGAKLATGHYARLEGGAGAVRLLRGADEKRDQSYFLWELSQAELSELVFPVGALTKAEAREVARRAGLAVADKPESQDLCFVPDGDAAGFVARRAAERTRPGRIVDLEGREVGAHEGIHGFTVGQRKGLGSHKLPLYVQAIVPERDEVVVGPASALEVREVRAAKARWIAGVPPPADEVLTVRVRHRHGGARGTVHADGDRFVFRALEPIRAPAPGQAAVVYRGDEVVGGGYLVRG